MDRLLYRPLKWSAKYTNCKHNPANERQVTLKVSATVVIAILGTQPARLPVLQVSGHSSLSNG